MGCSQQDKLADSSHQQGGSCSSVIKMKSPNNPNNLLMYKQAAQRQCIKEGTEKLTTGKVLMFLRYEGWHWIKDHQLDVQAGSCSSVQQKSISCRRALIPSTATEIAAKAKELSSDPVGELASCDFGIFSSSTDKLPGSPLRRWYPVLPLQRMQDNVATDNGKMFLRAPVYKLLVPLTDLEIKELVAEFFEIESKAAEAQESLEKESLAQVENDVREELAQNLHGDALNFAISTEMQTFREEWEAVLDDLETKSALLLVGGHCIPDTENLTDAQVQEQILSNAEDINQIIEELSSKEPLFTTPQEHPSPPAKFPAHPDYHYSPIQSFHEKSLVQEPVQSPFEDTHDAEVVSIHDSEDDTLVEAAEPPLPCFHFKIPSIMPIDVEDEQSTISRKQTSTSTVFIKEIAPWTVPARVSQYGENVASPYSKR
ncbi:hypothetical protein KSP40_PGU002720 [Platanthera guangdongensis]|uniref:Uncharacterized protein n=1 Tax=Platanthera guangdongensis TaxID=2320717 RepID=A0ABR2MV53_9ASPA